MFAIPANQEFVYIHRLANGFRDPKRVLLANLFHELNKKTSSTTPNHLADKIMSNETLDENLFRKFIFDHTNKAFTDGFNDNIGRTNVNPVFELPKASVWYTLFDALVDYFLKRPRSQKVLNNYLSLKSHVDIDVQLSEQRCKKILPQALNLYQESLPNHYTKSQHQTSVNIQFIFINANYLAYSNHFVI